jgi:hypothetical protein
MDEAFCFAEMRYFQDDSRTAAKLHRAVFHLH